MVTVPLLFILNFLVHSVSHSTTLHLAHARPSFPPLSYINAVVVPSSHSTLQVLYLNHKCQPLDVDTNKPLLFLFLLLSTFITRREQMNERKHILTLQIWFRTIIYLYAPNIVIVYIYSQCLQRFRHSMPPTIDNSQHLLLQRPWYKIAHRRQMWKWKGSQQGNDKRKQQTKVE